MNNPNTKPDSTPPPLPGKPRYKPALYVKIILGFAILTNATAQFIGEEFGPRTVGALLGSVVIMPAILLVIALVVWLLAGRNSHPANLVLATLSALYLLMSLAQLGSRLFILHSVEYNRVSQGSVQANDAEESWTRVNFVRPALHAHGTIRPHTTPTNWS